MPSSFLHLHLFDVRPPTAPQHSRHNLHVKYRMQKPRKCAHQTSRADDGTQPAHPAHRQTLEIKHAHVSYALPELELRLKLCCTAFGRSTAAESRGPMREMRADIIIHAHLTHASSKHVHVRKCAYKYIVLIILFRSPKTPTTRAKLLFETIYNTRPQSASHTAAEQNATTSYSSRHISLGLGRLCVHVCVRAIVRACVRPTCSVLQANW